MRLPRFVKMPDNGQLRLSIATVAAAGTGVQTDAAALTAQVNLVTNSNSVSNGVYLPTPAESGPILVVNTVSGTSLQVFPKPGRDDTINGAAPDAVFALGSGMSAWFVPSGATAWSVNQFNGTGTIVLAGGQSIQFSSGGQAILSRTALAAAGSGQSDAAVIANQIVVVTGADNAKGVALPAAGTAVGPHFVFNDSNSRLLVYPINGGNDQINALSVNAPFTLNGGELAMFVATSSTQYFTPTGNAQSDPTPLTRTTIANGATIAAAELKGRVLFQDASGGAVTMTTRTGTQIAADMPEMRTGDALQIFVASNHASNTSTLGPGATVTAVGSGAVTQTGGTFLLIKTGATTFDLVRVG